MIVRIALLLLLAVAIPAPWREPPLAAPAPATPVVPAPLAPADTSSPRDTLFDFMVNVSNALHAWQAREPRDVVEHYTELAFEAFDFSQVPQENRLARQLETTLSLKEILDRIALPPVDEIPGDEDVAHDGALIRWTIPGTRITIARMKDGPRAGDFLFTAETVEQLPMWFDRAKSLPYKPGATEGVLDAFLHTPGIIVPHAWATALPSWSRTVILGKAMWQWLSLAVIVVGAWLTIRGLLRRGRRWDKRHRNLTAASRFATPCAILASVAVLYASRFALVFGARFYGEVSTFLSSLLSILMFVGLAWFVVLVTGRIADAINEARQVKEGSIDSQLVRVLLRLISLFVLISLFLYAANFFGIPLAPVIASLGVGGLAIALAVRPTLENIIGGLTLFADKPVRIGDFCKYGDDHGTVEAIGLRSTRLRKQDDTLVSLPNSDFSQRELANYSQRRQRLYRTTLGLRYETTAEQLRYVIAELRTMLLGHPMVSAEKLHVRFDSFGAYSLDVQVFAYVRTTDWLDYLAVREDINFRIIDIVNDAGTGFAFPSQTTYIGRDAGLNAERGRQVEDEVEAWRDKGQLPFPEFDPALQWEKEDILDYPPRGSPDYVRRQGLTEPSPQASAEAAPSSHSTPSGWKRFLARKRA